MFVYLRCLYRTIKKNTDCLAVASKQNGIEVNADKTKYMVLSRGQHAGQNHSMNYIQSRLNSGNACYHSVQNFLSSSLLFKN
jgi:hypothetical protein